MSRKRFSQNQRKAALALADKIGAKKAAKKLGMGHSTISKWRADRRKKEEAEEGRLGFVSPEEELEKEVQKQGLKEPKERHLANLMIRLVDDDLVVKIHNPDGSVRGTLTLNPDGLSWVNVNTKLNITRCVPYNALHNLITSGLFD